MEDSTPNIFEYSNYRQFLFDMYNYLKWKKSQFSYRYFSKRAGFSSPNFLKLVIEGKRNLSLKSIQQFAKTFQLPRAEREFFENLVLMNQAEGEEERNYYYSKISNNKQYLKTKFIEKAQYQYYSHWYIVPIRELISVYKVGDNYDWIAKKLSPAITEKEAKEAIDILLELNMVTKDNDGVLHVTENNISSFNSQKEIANLAIRNFHREMSKKAAESLDRFVVEERNFTALTIAIPQEKLPMILDKIHSFRRELFQLIDNESRNKQTEKKDSINKQEVYQINFQIFPLTSGGNNDKNNAE